MKTSTLIMLGVGAFLLYKLVHKTATVTLPGATGATPLLPPTGDTMSVGLVPPNIANQSMNAALVATSGTPGIV